MGAQDAPRGAKLRVKLGAVDEIMLDIAGTVIARLDVENGSAPSAEESAEEEDDANTAMPLVIAVDMSDETTTATTETGPIAP